MRANRISPLPTAGWYKIQLQKRVAGEFDFPHPGIHYGVHVLDCRRGLLEVDRRRPAHALLPRLDDRIEGLGCSLPPAPLSGWNGTRTDCAGAKLCQWCANNLAMFLVRACNVFHLIGASDGWNALIFKEVL
jgi:hypothetical protein